LRRTSRYVSLLRISGALHVGIFEQPARKELFCKRFRETQHGCPKIERFFVKRERYAIF
jgi:hypothetical protein